MGAEIPAYSSSLSLKVEKKMQNNSKTASILEAVFES
jgi:hypothetical protein